MVILEETLSAHSACLIKIPRWIALVHENVSVNKSASRKQITEIIFSGLLSVFFFKFYIWLSQLLSKTVQTDLVRIFELAHGRKF